MSGGACFLTSAVIFGEQFLREGRIVMTGGTCNNFSNDMKRFFYIIPIIITVVVVIVIIVVSVVIEMG
jgi:hypothetical protein